MRSLLKLTSIMALMLLVSSCATKALWKATDPAHYVRVDSSLVTEDELKKRGIKYYWNDWDKAYYMEKSDLNKLRDYSLRLFGTPISVAIDAATTLVVVGVAVVLAQHGADFNWYEKCQTNEQCRQHYYENDKKEQPTGTLW